MKLTSIRFKNYKAFADEEEILFKPITILFGKNSAGKSAIARLPLLFNLTQRAGIPASFDLTNKKIHFGDTFSDLVNKQNETNFISFTIGFAKGSSEFHYSFNIRQLDATPRTIIESFSLFRDGIALIKAEINLDDRSGKGFLLNYGDDEIIHSEVQFSGIIPSEIDPSPLNPDISKAFYNLAQAFESVNYLGPFRVKPKPVFRKKGGVRYRVGHLDDDFKGEDAPYILEHSMYSDLGLLENISKWYADSFDGWALDVDSDGDNFNLVLVSPENPARVRIPLSNVGEGMGQILPLAVRGFLSNEFSHGIDIVEQPELHLHPTAHGAIADLLIQAVERDGNTFLVETHSENLLLRLRRRIAERKINPEHVALYYVSGDYGKPSTLKKIEIDRDGEVDFWPKGIFSEDLDEVRAIRTAQRTHNN
jgi:hypothetical protein